jgi:hypothetical protein
MIGLQRPSLQVQWVSDAGHEGLSTRTSAGVRKPPKNETAGNGATESARAMGIGWRRAFSGVP